MYGGVETGGTWCVCAVATGPSDVRAHDQFRLTSPEETLERIVGGGVMERSRLFPMVCSRLRTLNGGYLGTPMLGERVDEHVVPPQLGDRAGVLGAIALAETVGA